MRSIILLLLLAVSLGTPAWGQMAAPSLVPATPGMTDAILTRTPSFVPINPAVMSWRKYSIGGAGIARANALFSATGADFSFPIDFEDTYAGLQWVGETYAFGAQYFHETSMGPFARFESEGRTLALSRHLGGSISLGGAYYEDVYKEIFDSVDTTTVAGLKAGISARFLESLYVGLVAGQESIKRTESGDPKSNWNNGRSVSGAGLGYAHQGPLRLHVEVSMLQQGDVGNVGGIDAEVIKSDQTQTVTLESGWDVWVFGLSANHRVQEHERSSGSLNFTMDGNEFTVGIVPEKGMSLLFHYGMAELNAKEAGNTTTVITTSRSLSAIWIF